MDLSVNSQAVKEYLNKDNPRPVLPSELMTFWKELTPEERQQFGDESRKLLAA